MSDFNNNNTESIWGVISSILGYIMAHFFSVDAVLFKVAVAPAISASVGFFVIRFWKKQFKKDEKSN